ncbi:hypothetical protein ABEF93_005042 [Exophiala dermatitidis]
MLHSALQDFQLQDENRVNFACYRRRLLRLKAMEGQKLQYYSTTANVVWSPLEGEFRLHQLPKRNQTQPLQLLFRFLNLNHATVPRVPQVDAIVAASGLRLEICLRFLGFPSRRVSHRPRVVAAMTRTHRGIRLAVRSVRIPPPSLSVAVSHWHTPHAFVIHRTKNQSKALTETAADSEHPAVWVAVVAST